MKTTVVFAEIVFGAATLSADTVVGRLENGGVDVGAGETQAVTSPLTISADGTFIKTGAGTLNLPFAACETVPNRLSYHVLDGTLNLTDDAVAAPALAAPAFLTEKAAAWFSAADGDYITVSGDNVVNWYDVRETDVTAGGFMPTRRYMAHACKSGKTDQQQTKTTFLGHNAVYFGGYAARNLGGYMQLKKPDGSNDDLPYVWNVFYVHGVNGALGTVIGHTVHPSDLMVGASTPAVTSAGYKGLCLCRADSTPGLMAGRYYRNGVYVDPFQETMYPGTFECVNIDFAGNATGFDCFYNNRNADNRFGGDYISEAIVFTNRLTETERVQVERYLMRKWNLMPKANPGQTFGLAEDATATLTAAGTVTTVAATNVQPIVFKGTGEVRLEGSGTRVLAPETFNGFNGTLDVGSGTFFSRFGLFPAVAAVAGKTYATTLTRLGTASDVRNGLSLATASAAVGEVEKTGPETLPVARVAADVKKLRVRGGTLSLRGKGRVTEYVAGGAISAVFANPDMEKVQYADPNGSRGRLPMTNGETRDGWTLSSSGFTAGYVVGPLLRSGYQWRYDVPEGRQALYVFSNDGKSAGYATLHTTVTFPCAGTYRVSWRSTNNRNGEMTPQGYSIIFGSDFAHAEVVHHAFNGAVGAPREYLRLQVPQAGTYCFGFRVDENYGGYYAMIFDDLRADQESEQAAMEVVPIPNGDFEQVTTNGAAAGVQTFARRNLGNKVDPLNQPIGWTLDQGDGWTASVGGATIGLSAPGTPWHKSQEESPTANSNYCTFSRPFDGSCGLFQLFMAGSPAYANNACASTTFKVEKAGTYYLRGKVAKWNVATLDVDYFGQNGEVPSVRAQVTVGGVTTDLGSVSSRTVNPDDTLWPTSFTVTANASVTLRLNQTTAKAACLVDDFVLVRADDVPVVEGGSELIANGSFEQFSGIKGSQGERSDVSSWTLTDGTGSSQQKVSFWGYGSAGSQYVIVPFDGEVVCCVRGSSALSQTLPPLTAGRYRFRVAANTRWTPGYDENGIRVTLNDPSDGTVKYTVCEISEVTNYHAQVTFHDVVVDQPGTYVLKIQGTHADQKAGDRAYAIDGLSLKRVSAAYPPSLPEDLKIDVAEGAKLDLDYDGKVKVRGVSFNGVFKTGIVDESTCPGLVTGRGQLEVCPHGMAIIFR